MPGRGRRNQVGGPNVVVTLVHGTLLFAWFWAWLPSRFVKWTRPGSSLSESLEQGGFEVTRFRWSGRNSHRARLRAARELADHILEQIERRPHARQWIVAHSHGGNIALHAVRRVYRRRSDALGVSTIALATPFIHARPRSISDWPLFAILLFEAFVMVVAPVVAVGGPQSTLERVVVVLGLAFAVQMVPCTLGAFMHGNILRRGYRRGLIESIHAPAVALGDLLVVRAAGDEASGVLVAGQFTGWMGAVAVRYLTNIWLWAGLILAILWSAVLGATTGWSGFGWVFGWAMNAFAIVGLAVVTTVAVMLTAFLIFGVDGPFVGIFAFCSAEASPPGKALLLQLEPFDKRKWRRLSHSLYEDARVADEIVEAIRRSSSGRPEAGAPRSRSSRSP